MEAYERRMASLRSGEFVPPSEDIYDPAADMKAHATRHKKVTVDQESYMSRDQLMELRKVQNERIEVGMFCGNQHRFASNNQPIYWMNETSWDGRETKYGRQNGRHRCDDIV
ncbi:hypothetical protein JVU11DRAFT_1067 [Chiua virens]|nr:hypothetical protein JVU11DRAFT_1067 [Chiua virens]